VTSPLGEFVPGHMPANLREYWVHGKGAAKIKWGVPHDFDRCVTHLRKYFPTNPKGLCNILHREALGVAPGQEHAVDTDELETESIDFHSECTEEFCLAPLHKGPCRGYKHGGGIHAPHVSKPGRHESNQHPTKKVAKVTGGKGFMPAGMGEPAPKAPRAATPRAAAPKLTAHERDVQTRIKGIDSAIAKLGPRSEWGRNERETYRKLKLQRDELIKQSKAKFATDEVDELVDDQAEGFVDDSHDECAESDFCLHPLHPGPCKGEGIGHHLRSLIPGHKGRSHGGPGPDPGNGESYKPHHDALVKMINENYRHLTDDQLRKRDAANRKRYPKTSRDLDLIEPADLAKLDLELEAARAEMRRRLMVTSGGTEGFAANPDAENDRKTCPKGQHMMPNGECMDDDADDMFGLMSAKDINDLPDSAFAYIEPGGTKDADGKTVPRSLRHFPIHDAAHVRNALARASQSPFGTKALTKIHKAAKKMGVGDYAADPEADELFALMPKTKGWRGMIAPIDKPTGDGRRFGPGALSNRDLPLPARFQRSSGEGHSGAVTVGRLLNIEYNDDGVWGEGDWMDPEVVPEVTEAQLLMEKNVLGASVDLDEFQYEARHKASGDKFSPDKHCQGGTCEASEAYVTNGRISALTFVGIPAFAEAAKIELFEIVDEAAVRAAFAADGFDLDSEEDCGCGGDEEEPVVVTAATVVVELPSAAVFSRQDATDLVGFAARGDQLFGYVAGRNTCHTEIKGTCQRPPIESDYNLFHRYLVPAATDSGLIATGRFTVGYGNFVGKCGCCNADDHACSYASLADTIAHYDLLDKVIDARVGVDDRGIWWAGTWASGATAEAKRIVEQRGMSGDWRMFDGQLHLVEVMGVSVTRPAFPIGANVNGRQLSLVAAGPAVTAPDPATQLSEMVSQAVADALAKDRRRLEAAWMLQGINQFRAEFVQQERERLLNKMGG